MWSAGHIRGPSVYVLRVWIRRYSKVRTLLMAGADPVFRRALLWGFIYAYREHTVGDTEDNLTSLLN